MKKLKLVIVHDDPNELLHLKDQLSRYEEHWKIEQLFSDPFAACEYLQRNYVDLLVLKFHLGPVNAFDLIKKANRTDTPVIFIADSNEHVMSAFEFAVVDFLISPVKSDSLLLAISKMIKAINHLNRNQMEAFKEMITDFKTSAVQAAKLIVNNQHSVEILAFEEIEWCEAKGPYTTFFKIDGRQVVATKPLKFYEQLLIANGFFRLHRSYMVNSDQLQMIDKVNLNIRLSNGQVLPIGPDRLSRFINDFNDRMYANQRN